MAAKKAIEKVTEVEAYVEAYAVIDTLGDIAAKKAIETVCDCWATKLMVDYIEDTRNGIGRGVKHKC